MLFLGCLDENPTNLNSIQALREGALFLIANASVLSAAALAFVFFCALTRLFSDSGEDR